MRRADRLFQIVQILRRTRQPVTADAIAEELETSKRTVYRDIADLIGQRAPIRGEAGVGYILEDGFDLPPLMLTPDEVEAAVLGAQMVAARGDPALRRAAEDLIAKIGAVIRESLRIVWPFAIGYYETSRLIVAWCELRQDFRSFRTDRVSAAEFTDIRYP